MPNVRGKFRCAQAVVYDNGPTAPKMKTVHFHPVMDGSAENKAFNKFSPSGKIEIGIAGDAPAFDSFEVGKEYYVDFTVVEPVESPDKNPTSAPAE